MENRFEAEVGIAAVDTGDRTTFGYRAKTRFSYPSSLKVFIAAEFLRTVGPGDRAETIRWTAEDVGAAGYSPVTAERTEEGLTLDQLVEAAARASDNTTGDTLVRAGAPTDWVVADKSGGAGAIRNDIAVVTPPGRDPIIITVLTTRTDPAAEYDDELVARAAAVVLDELR